MARELICVCCPMGCRINADNSSGEWEFSGYTCKRGLEYAKSEVTHPSRVLTASVPLVNRSVPVSAKTAAPIPKELLMAAMEQILSLKAEAPIAIGDVILKDVCSTGISLVATSEIL
jgi:CxxC motif-containing protein